MTTAYRNNSMRCNVKSLSKLHTKKNVGIVLVLFVALMLLYVYQTSALASRTFVINELESTVESLEQENNEIAVQIAENRSLQKIEERLVGKTYVTTRQISYITPIKNTVAQR